MSDQEDRVRHALRARLALTHEWQDIWARGFVVGIFVALLLVAIGALLYKLAGMS